MQTPPRPATQVSRDIATLFRPNHIPPCRLSISLSLSVFCASVIFLLLRFSPRLFLPLPLPPSPPLSSSFLRSSGTSSSLLFLLQYVHLREKAVETFPAFLLAPTRPRAQFSWKIPPPRGLLWRTGEIEERIKLPRDEATLVFPRKILSISPTSRATSPLLRSFFLLDVLPDATKETEQASCVLSVSRDFEKFQQARKY